MARTELAATQEDLVGKTDMFTRVTQCLQSRVRFGYRWFDHLTSQPEGGTVQQADDYAYDAPAASPIDGAAVTLDALAWPLVRQERATLMASLQARAPEATAAAAAAAALQPSYLLTQARS